MPEGNDDFDIFCEDPVTSAIGPPARSARLGPHPLEDKKVYWRSADGLWAVIRGPIPKDIRRSETRPLLHRAIDIAPSNTTIKVRAATLLEDFIKISTSLLPPPKKGRSNTWGELCP